MRTLALKADHRLLCASSLGRIRSSQKGGRGELWPLSGLISLGLCDGARGKEREAKVFQMIEKLML